MTSHPDLAADLDLALRLADAAREISLARFKGPFAKRIKADGSVVTEVDEQVEDALRDILARERPDDAILGEERGASGSGPRRWIMDAIDGTQSFVDGTTHWATLIALEVSGEIVVGVCDDAPIDRRYWATKGGGAFRLDAGGPARRLEVTAERDLSRARSFVPPPQYLRDDAARAMAAALAAATRPAPYEDHPALQVAFGGYEVALFVMAGPWDLAAPAIVVEEAGGRFTDLDGRGSLTRGAVFTNGALHGAVMECLRAARG